MGKAGLWAGLALALLGVSPAIAAEGGSSETVACRLVDTAAAAAAVGLPFKDAKGQDVARLDGLFSSCYYGFGDKDDNIELILDVSANESDALAYFANYAASHMADGGTVENPPQPVGEVAKLLFDKKHKLQGVMFLVGKVCATVSPSYGWTADRQTIALAFADLAAKAVAQSGAQ